MECGCRVCVCAGGRGGDGEGGGGRMSDRGMGVIWCGKTEADGYSAEELRDISKRIIGLKGLFVL